MRYYSVGRTYATRLDWEPLLETLDHPVKLAIATIDVVDFAVPARHFNDVGIVAGNPPTLLTVYDCERGWEGLYWHTGGLIIIILVTVLSEALLTLPFSLLQLQCCH